MLLPPQSKLRVYARHIRDAMFSQTSDLATSRSLNCNKHFYYEFDVSTRLAATLTQNDESTKLHGLELRVHYIHSTFARLNPRLRTLAASIHRPAPLPWL